MIYRATFSDWIKFGIITGALYGFFMGIFMGIFMSFTFPLDPETNLMLGIFVGLFFGTVYTISMALIASSIAKKAKPLREEISKVRKIVCEGPATHKKSAINLKNVGGWLFLSEDAIEFYPLKLYVGGKNVGVPLDDIKKIERTGNIISISTTEETYQFIVDKGNLWEETINKTL